MATSAVEMENRILALAYAPGKTGKPGEPIGGKTALQKLLFHLRKEAQEAGDTAEIPHFYGPFDEQAEVVAEQLEASGYLKIRDGQVRLTERGIHEGKVVWESKLTNREREIISHLKSYFADLSTDEILAITYAKYPETATDSIADQELKRRGKAIALGLLSRGKVSADLGAKIAGMPLREFMRELSRHKIPVVEREVP
jgi:predicted HTH domain antitoxin